MDKSIDSKKNKIDFVVKVILIVIIILLLFRNCTLLMQNNEYKNKDSNNNSDLIEIMCNKDQCKPVIIEKLSFVQDSFNVKRGSTQKLIVLVNPSSLASSDLTWKSSDESIATVDNSGVVKGLKNGQVTITVTSPNGVATSCVVNVVVDSIEVNKIILNTNNITLKIGDTNQIISKVEPETATERDLVWSSSDSSIVSVDNNGKIKGLKVGTVTITVKTKDGRVMETCTVNVSAIKVNEIILNPTRMSLRKGGSGQIVATIKPSNATDKDIVWITSDSSVAKVDSSGKVTGVNEGTATITAKTKDGKVVATCTVNIMTDYVPAKEINLSMDETSINEGTFEQVYATIKPENATERNLIWSSSDESIATVDSTGKVTGISNGTAVITARTEDGSVSSTITVTVKTPTYDGDVEAYDEDKDPITWNGSNDLKIFSESVYNLDGVLAPESENTYKFIVKNNTKYKIKYNINFVETNNYNINMQYKLKKNDSYIINNYSRPDALEVNDFVLKSGESDTYYLDWKWISSDNDTQIGSQPDAMYKLVIEVKAESING